MPELMLICRTNLRDSTRTMYGPIRKHFTIKLQVMLKIVHYWNVTASPGEQSQQSMCSYTH